MNKSNLIYIVSNGHSGSTLLELLLHTHPNMWTTGELNILPWELEKTTQLCGCGNEVKNCDFWQKAVNNLEISKKTLSPFRRTHQTRKVLRPKHLFNILFNKKSKSIKFRNFCNLNTKLLKNIQKTAQENNKEIKNIISSSKGPYRLFWLSKCKSINMKAIHIIKDPRAFVYSNIKNISGIKVFFKSLRMTIRYIIENWIMTKVSKTMSDSNFKLIRYEDLASRPEETMKEIVSWLGIDRKWNIDSFREKENHGIAGNTMRFETKDIILDKKWKKDMNSFLKFIISTLTYFSGKKYGYFK